jgi:hypothetical protein
VKLGLAKFQPTKEGRATTCRIPPTGVGEIQEEVESPSFVLDLNDPPLPWVRFELQEE